MIYPPDQEALCLLAIDQLAECLTVGGLKVSRQGNALRFAELPFQIVCREVQGQGEVYSPLFLLWLGPEGPIIRESMATTGESADDALKEAAFHWTMSIFNAAQAWFDSQSCPGHLSSERTLILQSSDEVTRQWRLISSPLLSFSIDDARKRRAKTVRPPETWEVLNPLFSQLALSPQPHWIKAFYSRLPDGEADGDVRVDSEPHEAGKVLLLSRYVAPLPGWYRQFHILWPGEQVDSTQFSQENDESLHTPQKQKLWPRFWKK